MPSKKEQVGFRISDEGLAILYALQEHYGLSQSGVFELLLRDCARREELTINQLHTLNTVSTKRKSRVGNAE